jgi:hypothetical protein
MAFDTYDTGETHDPRSGSPQGPRPWVSILFECCNVYARVYRRPDQMFYRGRCPRCLRVVQLRVGPDGIPARFFRAY